MRRSFFLLALGLATLPLLNVVAQTPAPIIVQVVGQTPGAAAAKRASAGSAADSPLAALPQLQEMLTTNAATIKKQEAALATLDELQKAAEELKIFSKRG